MFAKVESPDSDHFPILMSIDYDSSHGDGLIPNYAFLTRYPFCVALYCV